MMMLLPEFRRVLSPSRGKDLKPRKNRRGRLLYDPGSSEVRVLEGEN